MCVICGIPLCNCGQVTLPPCTTCQEENGCNPKISANCIIDTPFECNTFLDRIYNCLISQPEQYQRYCDLWAACSALPPVCPPLENLTVAGHPTIPTSIIVTWTTIGTSTYDIYLDTILIQSNVSSPYTLAGVTAGVVHVVRVVNHCENGGSNYSEVTFSLCLPATTFAVNAGASTPNSILVEWTAAPFTAYDLYLNGLLVQVGATSPYVYNGLTPNTLYTLTIVSKCPSLSATIPIFTSYQITYTTDP